MVQVLMQMLDKTTKTNTDE